MRAWGRFGTIGLVGLATPAFAQALPSPAQVTPPTREQVQRATPAPAELPPSKLTVEGGIERAPCPLAEPRFAAIRFELKEAVFDNLRGLPAEALKPAYEAYVGKTVPIAAVCEIRDAAATILRRAGYVAAVQVPPQRIDSGTVHFDVLMAKLVRLQVRGKAGRSERLIAAYLNKLTEQPLFNERDAERYLLMARDLPGYDVHLTLRAAGSTPGDVVGEVTVSRIPFVLSANIQNYGSNAVGRWGGLISAQANDLLGLGDRLTLGVFNSADVHEQTVLQAGYLTHVGAEGFALEGRFTYAWTRPDIGGGNPLKSRSLVASLEGSYPLIRSQRRDLRAVAGIDLVNQDLDFSSIALTRDRLRVLYGRLDFGTTDPLSVTGTKDFSAAFPRWRFAGSLELRHGMHIFGADQGCGPAPAFALCTTVPTPSRVAGKPTGTLVRAQGEFDWRPQSGFTFVFSPRAQYAFDPLLTYEEFSAGNYSVGRGYDPGIILGDSGAGFSIEGRLGELAPASRSAFAWQPYAFFDAAWVWNKDAAAGAVNRDRLYSVGGGVRVAWGDHARLDVAVVQPLHRTAAQINKGDTRFLVSLTTRLLPWSSK